MYSGTWLAEQTGVKAPLEQSCGQRENLADGRERGEGWEIEIFLKERSHTGKSEEDDLLVSPLLGGVVVDGDTARGDLASLLRPGNVTIILLAGTQLKRGNSITHEKVTSWGKASPALKPLVAILSIGLSMEERERDRS